MTDNSRKWLYDNLNAAGYNVGKNYEEFDSLLTNNEESRRWAYDTANSLGYNVGKDYAEFSDIIAPKAEDITPTIKGGENGYTLTADELNLGKEEPKKKSRVRQKWEARNDDDKEEEDDSGAIINPLTPEQVDEVAQQVRVKLGITPDVKKNATPNLDYGRKVADIYAPTEKEEQDAIPAANKTLSKQLAKEMTTDAAHDRLLQQGREDPVRVLGGSVTSELMSDYSKKRAGRKDQVEKDVERNANVARVVANPYSHSVDPFNQAAFKSGATKLRNADELGMIEEFAKDAKNRILETLKAEVQKEADLLEMSLEDYINKIAVPALQQRMYEEWLAPKEERAKKNYNGAIAAVENSLIGMLLGAARTDTEKYLSQVGQEAWRKDASLLDRALSGAGSMFLDLPIFGGFGSLASVPTKYVGGQVFKHMAKNEAKKVIARGASEAAAQRYANYAVTNGLKNRILLNLSTSPLQSGLTFGMFDAGKAALNMSLNGEWDWGELGKSAGGGFLLGAALGGTNAVGGALTHGLTGATKAGAKVAEFAVENAVFTEGGRLIGKLHGQQPENGWWEDYLESGATLLMLKAPNIVKNVSAIKGDKEASEVFAFNELEREQLGKYGEDLNAVLESLLPRGEKMTIEGKGVSLDGIDSGVLSEEYMRVMSDVGIPMTTKAKLAAIVEGKVMPAPRVVDAQIEGNRVMTYDPMGRLVEVKEYRNEAAAKKEMSRLAPIMEKNGVGVLEDMYIRIKGYEADDATVREWLAKNHNVTAEDIAVILAKDNAKDPSNPLTKAEQKILDSLREARREGLSDVAHLNEVLTALEAVGINAKDIVSGIEKPFSERTEAEQRAVNAYRNALVQEVYPYFEPYRVKGAEGGTETNGDVKSAFREIYSTSFAEEVSPIEADKAYRAYQTATAKADKALGLNGKSVEEWMNGRSIAEVADGNAKVAEVLTEYFSTKMDFEGRRDRFIQDRDRAYSESDMLVDEYSNNGMIYTTKIDGQDVYITGGNIVYDDGGINWSASDEVLYVRMPDGKVIPVAKEKFRDEIISESAENVKAAKRAEVDAKYKAEFDAAEAAAAENGRKPIEVGAEYEVVFDGDVFRVKVEGRDENGDVIISSEGASMAVPEGFLQDAMKQAEVLKAESGKALQTENGEVKTENQIEVAPVVTTATTEMQTAPVAQAETVQPAPKAAFEQNIPVDEKGKKMWEQSTPEYVAEYIRVRKPEDVEAQMSVVSGMIEGLEKQKSKMDAMDAMDVDDKIAFWNKVGELIGGAKEVVDPIAVLNAKHSSALTAFNSMLENIRREGNEQKAAIRYEGLENMIAELGKQLPEGYTIGVVNGKYAIIETTPRVQPVEENNESTLSQTSDQVVDHYSLKGDNAMLKDMEAVRKSNREEYGKISPAYDLFYKAKERGLYPNELEELRAIVKGTSLEGKVDGWFTPVMTEGGNAPGNVGVYADNQGNPVDADGKLIIEEVASIDEITDEDFENPTRNVQLPAIPENVANAIGTEGRPVVIKKNVFTKNSETHVELEPEDSRNILSSALYNPNLVGSTQPIKRPDYKVAIRTGEKNAVVVLDVYREKDYVEIVGWRLVNEKGLAKMQRQAEREGGQFLILSPNDGSAAALSALPLGSSSASEDTTQSANEQENTQKSDETAENGGEKMYSPEELAEAKEQLGELNATSAPEFAARLFSIKPWKTLEEANAALKELLASYGETLNGQSLAVMPFLDKAQGLIGEYNKSQEPRSTEETAEVSKEVKPVKIEDVGEKIGGARKDVIRKYADKIKLDGKTFGTMFPKPEIDQLVEAGLPLDRVAAVKAMFDNAKREYERTKKRMGKDKALSASLFYAMYAKNVLNGETDNFDLKYNGWVFTDWGKEYMKANIALYRAVFEKLGAEYGKMDLAKYAITPLDAQHKKMLNLKALNESNAKMQALRAKEKGEEPPVYKDGDLINFVGENHARPSDQFETLEEAVNAMVERIGKEVKPGAEALYKPEVYWKTDERGRADYSKTFVGVKVRGFGTVDLMEFKSSNEARQWLDEHGDDFQQMAAAKEVQVKAENKKPLPKYSIEYTLDRVNSQYAVVANFGKGKVHTLRTFDFPEDDARARMSVFKDEVMPFLNSQEAVQAANEYAEELQQKKSAPKNVVVEKNSRERMGVDWRNGHDATTEMFVDVEGKEPSVFGFRALEFGNYVSQKERQQYLNDIYDALMDMSEVLGVSPRALSLGGKLALAVGARGTSGASGHYEPYKNVINITKTKGAGVLAHEWLHALDRYFSNFDENALYPNGVRYATEKEYAENTRREIKDAFEKIMSAVRGGEYQKRSARLGDYWASDKELAARALQDYMMRKLDDRGQKNDFLSNHLAPEDWAGDMNNYPFPLGAEADRIAEAFDNFFATVEEKTEDGQTVLFQQGMIELDRENPAFERATKVTMEAVERLKANGLDIEVVSQEEADAMAELAEAQNAEMQTSKEIEAKYPDWLEGTTTESGKHSTQVEGTRKTYKKVGDWIDENMGKDVAILDASSGMGYGTADLRERGFNIEDVEPYQSEDRKQNNPATYSSYADIEKQYDYIISNAVLNVIPDDWRTDVLHNMADKLKNGGKLFINTRKAGEERSIKDKIELDSPQEVLVKRNGRIASYQRFFTPQELKGWIESELGDGYTVEIANKANSGTNGLAAVVVTKNNESPANGKTSESGQPISNHKGMANASLTNVSAKVGKNAERANRLDAIISSVEEFGEMGPHEFLHEVVNAMLLSTDVSTIDSRYAKLGGGVTLRLADHYGNASNYKGRKDAITNYGLVVKLSTKAFVPDNKVDYLEYVYFPDKLTKERQIEIAKGLKAFMETGRYELLPKPDKVHPSGKFVGRTELSTTNGKVYGWAVDGKIRLTPDGINPNTPVHEYAHLWGADVEKNNPKLWNEVVEAMKLSPVWNEVANDANYSNIHGNDSRMASEVLSRLSGRENYRRTMEEAEKEIAAERDIVGKVQKKGILNRIKNALRNFWNWVQRNVFRKKENATAKATTEVMPWEEFANSVVGDFYKGKNPNVKESPLEKMFMGEKGAENLDKAEEATTRLDNLSVAREMESAGKDAKAVKLATGWERGADGKWRYETEDVKLNRAAELFSLENHQSYPIAESLDKGRVDFNGTIKLADLVNDEELLKAYPEMEEYFVSFEKMDADTKGLHDFANQMIRINKDDISELESTLVHEIQHAIQSAEGFAMGGSTETIDVIKDKARVWAWRNALKETEKEHPELAGTTELEKVLMDEYRTEGLEEYIPTEEQRIKGFNLYARGYDGEGYERAFYAMPNVVAGNGFATYRRLAGEVESRNVQERMGMSPEERRNKLAEETEDVRREDQIFMYDALGSASEERNMSNDLTDGPVRGHNEPEWKFKARREKWRRWVESNTNVKTPMPEKPFLQEGEPIEVYEERMKEFNEALNKWKKEILSKDSEIEEMMNILYDGKIPEKNPTPEDEFTEQVFKRYMGDDGIKVDRKSMRGMIMDEIIERRRKIETNNFDDVVFINEVRKATTAEQRKAIPFIIEGTYNGEVSKELRVVVQRIKDWFENVYQAMQAADAMHSSGKIKNYVTHIWDKERTPKAVYENYINTRSKYTNRRSIDTYAEGIALGMVPKYDDICDIMLEYGHIANEAIANKGFTDFLHMLRVDGEPVLKDASKRDPMYVRTSAEALDGYKVHKYAKDIVENVLGGIRTENAAGWMQKLAHFYDVTGSLMKKINLSLSFFHHGALLETAVGAMNPAKAISTVFKNLVWDCMRSGELPALSNPEVTRNAVNHLVQLGATQDYMAKEVNRLTGRLKEMLKDFSDKHPNIVTKAAVAPAELLDFLNTGFDKVLWDYLHDGLKIYTFDKYAKEIEEYAQKKGLDSTDKDMLLNEAGQLVNDIYGGQFWELVDMSPATVKWLRRLLLSPDWTISTIRQALSPIGFGTLYKDYEKNWAQRTVGTGLSASFRRKQGVKFWITALLTFGALMNGLNAWRRKEDVDDELEKAEERRKTDPEYKSPYELKYPEGMKWYDYTMAGNTIGHQTHLFGWRYDDGKEGYIRWGKQFRELPELFLDKYGFSIPGPMLDKIVGKMNPAFSTGLAFFGFTRNGWQNKWMKDKTGWDATLGRVMMMAAAFMPYSIPTDEDKEFVLTDLIMPSSKGYSRYKAIRDFETAILSQDMDFVGAVYDACVMNKLDAEKLLEAAILRVEASAKAEYVEGVETLNDAFVKYGEDLDIDEKRAVRAKFNKLLQENAYKDFEKQEAADMVAEVLNGTYREEKLPDAYIANELPEDVRDAYKVDAIRLRLKKIVDDTPKEMRAANIYKNENQAKIDLYKYIVAANREIGKIMSVINIDPTHADKHMEEIRKIRESIINTANNNEYE